MHRNKVKEVLTQYKKNKDWLELYNETANIGASFVSVGGGQKENHSKVEQEVDRRAEKEEEYEKRKQFNEIVVKVLDRLPEEERMVIEHEYNLIDNDYYAKFDIANVPVADVVANLPFERRKYFHKLDNAYNLLEDKLSAVI